MDLVKLGASGLAAVMAVATGVQQLRVMGLDDALSSVTTARDTAERTLKATQDGLVTGSKRQDAAIVDLQSKIDELQKNLRETQSDLSLTQGRLEAAQANTLRMADLAEKLCSRRR